MRVVSFLAFVLLACNQGEEASNRAGLDDKISSESSAEELVFESEEDIALDEETLKTFGLAGEGQVVGSQRVAAYHYNYVSSSFLSGSKSQSKIVVSASGWACLKGSKKHVDVKLNVNTIGTAIDGEATTTANTAYSFYNDAMKANCGGSVDHGFFIRKYFSVADWQKLVGRPINVSVNGARLTALGETTAKNFTACDLAPYVRDVASSIDSVADINGQLRIQWKANSQYANKAVKFSVAMIRTKRHDESCVPSRVRPCNNYYTATRCVEKVSAYGNHLFYNSASLCRHLGFKSSDLFKSVEVRLGSQTNTGYLRCDAQ